MRGDFAGRGLHTGAYDEFDAEGVTYLCPEYAPSGYVLDSVKLEGLHIWEEEGEEGPDGAPPAPPPVAAARGR